MEFFLFIRNLNINIEASGTLKAVAKIQYLNTLVHGEALLQIDAFSAEVESASLEALTSIILGLGTYFSLLMRFPGKIARCTAELEICRV